MEKNRHDKLILKTFTNSKGLFIGRRIDLVMNGNRYPNIKEYLQNRYDYYEFYNEIFRRMKFGIEERPTCPVCGGKVKYVGRAKILYTNYCSKECKSKDTERKLKERIEASKEQKKMNTSALSDSSNIYTKKKNVESKEKPTKKRKLLTLDSRQIEILKEKNNSPLTDYGIYSVVEGEESEKKRKELDVPDFFDYEEFHDITNNYILSSCTSDLLIYNQEESERRENKMYDELKKIYPDIKRNYVSDKLPGYVCTFYIPSIDVYIENRCKWNHGGHPYLTKRYDSIILEELKKKGIDDKTWTEYDCKEREIAKKNSLKWVEYYRSEVCIVKQLIHIELTRLKYEVTEEEMQKEWKSICKSPGRLSNSSSTNKIIRYFQPQLSDKASEYYFSDYSNKWKIFENRHFYCPIRWEDIDNNIVIRGLSICGAVTAYSMFSSQLTKWFIHHMRMENKTCYDPTGGWGHRMLGATTLLKKYIYNDLSTSTVNGVKSIAEYLHLENVEFHNEDANGFVPSDDFDFMFTCPPYYAENHDTEKYECDGFHSQEEFNAFLNNLYDLYISKESCKVFGIVIREDMLTDKMRKDVVEEYPLKLAASHFQRTGGKKRFIEYLYIFKKNEL